MDIIQQEREEIIKENNTAQEQFETMLSYMNHNIQDFTIQSELSGVLDLSILGEKFRELKHISFHTGKIIEIRNVPVGIVKLECCGNLLTELENLPGTLLILNVNNNFIKTLDLSSTPYLEELYCKNNRIQALQRLPSSLLKLYCDQNQLQKLNLLGLNRLQVLHCSQNPLLQIDNLPKDIREFVAEDSPFAMEVSTKEDDNDPQNVLQDIFGSDSDNDSIDTQTQKKKEQQKEKAVDRKINYLDGIHVYFREKTKYEENLIKKRRSVFKQAKNKKMGRIAAQNVKPNCVYCNRPVGTKFYTDSTGYFAKCGDNEQPCGLNIKILRGVMDEINNTVHEYKHMVELDKDSIIQNKLNTLFNYYSEEEAIRLFKDKMAKYNENSSIYADILNQQKNLYFSDQRRELIVKKLDQIHRITCEINMMMDEYRLEDNPVLLKTAMRIYVQDLLPEHDNLQRLKYETMEMENNVLFQRPFALQQMEEVLDKPKVVHFKGM